MYPPANIPRIPFDPAPIPDIVPFTAPKSTPFPFDAIVKNSLPVTKLGASPPAVTTPLVGDAAPLVFLLPFVKSPKSSASPKVLISMYSIILEVCAPPANIPRVDYDNDASCCLAEVKSPKSIESPSDAIVR